MKEITDFWVFLVEKCRNPNQFQVSTAKQPQFQRGGKGLLFLGSFSVEAVSVLLVWGWKISQTDHYIREEVIFEWKYNITSVLIVSPPSNCIVHWTLGIFFPHRFKIKKLPTLLSFELNFILSNNLILSQIYLADLKTSSHVFPWTAVSACFAKRSLQDQFSWWNHRWALSERLQPAASQQGGWEHPLLPSEHCHSHGHGGAGSPWHHLEGNPTFHGVWQPEKWWGLFITSYFLSQRNRSKGGSGLLTSMGCSSLISWWLWWPGQAQKCVSSAWAERCWHKTLAGLPEPPTVAAHLGFCCKINLPWPLERDFFRNFLLRDDGESW